MTSLSEAKKRDFVSQMLTLLDNEKEKLVAVGFDPTAKAELIKAAKESADKAEIAQQEALAKAKEATKLSNNQLDVAYKSASDLADLLSGFLGKENDLIKQMRRFRS